MPRNGAGGQPSSGAGQWEQAFPLPPQGNITPSCPSPAAPEGGETDGTQFCYFRALGVRGERLSPTHPLSQDSTSSRARSAGLLARPESCPGQPLFSRQQRQDWRAALTAQSFLLSPNLRPASVHPRLGLCSQGLD